MAKKATTKAKTKRPAAKKSRAKKTVARKTKKARASKEVVRGGTDRDGLLQAIRAELGRKARKR